MLTPFIYLGAAQISSSTISSNSGIGMPVIQGRESVRVIDESSTDGHHLTTQGFDRPHHLISRELASPMRMAWELNGMRSFCINASLRDESRKKL